MNTQKLIKDYNHKLFLLGLKIEQQKEIVSNYKASATARKEDYTECVDYIWERQELKKLQSNQQIYIQIIKDLEDL